SMKILLSAVGGSGVVNAVSLVTKALGTPGLAGSLAMAGVAAGGIAVALGVTAVKAAGDFQAQTERLVTSAGEAQNQLEMVRQGVLQLSVDTATSTEQLANGLYYIESASYHGAAGLEVLTAAAQGAKSENADLDVVSKALLAEMVGYHMKASDATAAMNGL